MEGKDSIDANMLQGQAEIWRYMLNFADSMALKCAVELRIADIINSHGGPISLSQIASSIDSPSPDTTSLLRIMRLLVRRKIFTATPPPDGGEETLYGMTHASKWLLHNADLSLAPMLLLENHPVQHLPWHGLSGCVRDGGLAFKKVHGREFDWDLASTNPEFNKIFSDAMGCTAKITTRVIISAYPEAFAGIRSLVDVGGRVGAAIAEIVKAFPHIKGINFDLPYAVATAPEYPGVTHVGGDMFKAIPNADAVFMKWILHDWSDEDCVKILKSCRKAIPEKTGKVIIADAVLKPDGEELFDDTGLVFDLLMLAHTPGGKERTELEWKAILEEAGFQRYKITKIPALQSIIEAFPE